jgi:hypothetical protein
MERAGRAWPGRSGVLLTWPTVCAAQTKGFETTSSLVHCRVVWTDVKRVTCWRTDPAVRGAQALCRFDSRALSLLLKDLGKAGEGGRAAELFDRLRQLRGTDAGHLLSPLCDVYTYTAAIALCIHQQARPRRALRQRRVLCLQSSNRCAPHHSGCATHTQAP